MLRTLLPPAAGWLVVIAFALVALVGSLNYLGGTLYATIGSATAAKAPGAPDFVASVEPLPSGSISAVVPLPGQSQPATAAAETVPAPVLTTEPVPVEAVPVEMVATTEPVPGVEPPANAGPRMAATISVNVRDRPSNNSRVIGTLRSGAAVAVVGTQQGWMQIADGGQTGWVYGRYLKPVN